MYVLSLFVCCCCCSTKGGFSICVLAVGSIYKCMYCCLAVHLELAVFSEVSRALRAAAAHCVETLRIVVYNNKNSNNNNNNNINKHINNTYNNNNVDSHSNRNTTNNTIIVALK